MKFDWIGTLITLVLLVLCTALVYTVGNLNGKAEIQKLWDSENDAKQVVINKYKVEVGRLEAEHSALSQRNSDELEESKKTYEAAVAAITSEYEHRLRLTETRTATYKRLSEGSASDRDRLAEHAAQLDRSLEEGRALVGELKESLGQCEIVTGVLGTQILLDRNLLK